MRCRRAVPGIADRDGWSLLVAAGSSGIRRPRRCTGSLQVVPPSCDRGECVLHHFLCLSGGVDEQYSESDHRAVFRDEQVVEPCRCFRSSTSAMRRHWCPHVQRCVSRPISTRPRGRIVVFPDHGPATMSISKRVLHQVLRRRPAPPPGVAESAETRSGLGNELRKVVAARLHHTPPHHPGSSDCQVRCPRDVPTRSFHTLYSPQRAEIGTRPANRRRVVPNPSGGTRRAHRAMDSQERVQRHENPKSHLRGRRMIWGLPHDLVTGRLGLLQVRLSP